MRWTVAKTTVDDCKSISVSTLSSKGVFRRGPGQFWTWRSYMVVGGEERAESSMGIFSVGDEGEVDALDFSYTITRRTGEQVPCDYRVQLARTPCNFGGERYWFLCPLCGRQVANLYLPAGGTYFGCRHCYDLTYRSCQEHDKRVSALAKLPTDTLLAMSRAASGRASLLFLKAASKRLRPRW